MTDQGEKPTEPEKPTTDDAAQPAPAPTAAAPAAPTPPAKAIPASPTPPLPAPPDRTNYLYLAVGIGCGVLGLAALGAIAFAAITLITVWKTTGPAAVDAEKFLLLLGAGQVEKAYKKTAPALQEKWDEKRFSNEAEALGFLAFDASTWTDKSFDNDVVTLKGSIKTEDGTLVPVVMTLIQLGESWKVESFSGEKGLVPVASDEPVEGPDAGQTAGPAVGKELPQLPNEFAIPEYARKALQALIFSIDNKDFTALHGFSSKRLRDQITPEQLQVAFKDLIDQCIDFSEIDYNNLTFDKDPEIDATGTMILVGRVEGVRWIYHFEMKFIEEYHNWRLLGIGLRLETNPWLKDMIPKPEELDQLCRQTILILVNSANKKDFTDFNKYGSKFWRENFPPEKLMETFGDLGASGNLDLSSINNVAPVHDTPPALDENGVLHLKGYFPARPTVIFDQTYVLEGQRWRLNGISVQLK